MSRANCLIRLFNHALGRRLDVVGVGRLAIRLIDVIIFSSSGFNAFWWRYSILKFSNGGGWPARSGGRLAYPIRYVLIG
jgi:hypothetical protein